jgi:hypothetical protein
LASSDYGRQPAGSPSRAPQQKPHPVAPQSSLQSPPKSHPASPLPVSAPQAFPQQCAPLRLPPGETSRRTCTARMMIREPLLIVTAVFLIHRPLRPVARYRDVHRGVCHSYGRNVGSTLVPNEEIVDIKRQKQMARRRCGSPKPVHDGSA